MKVFNLAGAVLPGNRRQGSFSLPIIDDPQPPVFKKDVLMAVPENSATGTLIDNLVAVRNNKDCPLCKFTLLDSTDYVTVATNGEVRVKDETILDYESIHEIKIRVRVSDEVYNKYSDTTVTIPVKDVNENPTLAKQTFSVEENAPIGTPVDPGKVKFGDLDTALAFIDNVFAPEGGDTAYFDIDPDGVITTKRVFDFENEATVYQLVVRVSDRNDPTLFAIDTMRINLVDVNVESFMPNSLFTAVERIGKFVRVHVVENVQSAESVERIIFVVVL